MRRYEKIRIILWCINICLALLAFSLSIYLIVFEVMYKEKNQTKKLGFKGASNNIKSEPLLAQLSPTWQLIVGVVPQKKDTPSNPLPTKQKTNPASLPGMDQELRLIACACDTDPTKSYCVLEDLRTKKQMLVGEGYIIERLVARVTSINSQKIGILYQGKMYELEKRMADDTVTSRNKESNPSQGFKWIERVFDNAELEDTKDGVRVKEPGELRETGFLPGDLLLSLDGTLVYQKQALMNAFKQSSSLPFWSLILKRNGEKISLVILKKRRQ